MTQEKIAVICCESDEETLVVLEFDLTVVCDPRAAQIKFHELIAPNQTSPHYRVSHLRTG